MCRLSSFFSDAIRQLPSHKPTLLKLFSENLFCGYPWHPQWRSNQNKVFWIDLMLRDDFIWMVLQSRAKLNLATWNYYKNQANSSVILYNISLIWYRLWIKPFLHHLGQVTGVIFIFAKCTASYWATLCSILCCSTAWLNQNLVNMYSGCTTRTHYERWAW